MSSVKGGAIEVTVHKTVWTPGEQKTTCTLAITFNGDKRTYVQRSRDVIIDGTTADGGKSKLDRLEAMNNDREAFVKAGLGKWVDMEVRSAWDGSSFCQYSKEGGAAYRPHDKGSSEYICDPRNLGISILSRVDQTVGDSLGLNNTASLAMVGREKINGVETWHIKVVSAAGMERHFWIEDTEGFRVHQSKSVDPRGNVRLQVNKYDPEDKRSPIPSSILARVCGPDGKLRRQLEFQFTKKSLNIPISSSVGTIASLNLPRGEPVTDERRGRRVGQWNGHEVVPEEPDEATERMPARSTGNRSRPR
jgi:hypothetical protein